MATKKKKVINKKEETSTPSEVGGSASLEVSSDDVLTALIEAYKKSGTDEAKKKFAKMVAERLKQVAKKHACSEKYNTLILFDNTTMVKGDTDRLYESLKTLGETGKPLLLVLLSNGGEPGSAYLIGKLCQASTDENFIVTVPRQAKSAGTILAVAADEIHMGSLSELGPIDPQIKKMPALALKNSIAHIAELVAKHPDSAQMFAKYLFYAVEPISIGYYEREAESIKQYAEKLLEGHKTKLTKSVEEVANKLVYDYKDHGFIIDKSEAQTIFGEQMIKFDTDEYQLGNDIYLELSKLERIADILGYNFYFIGSFDSEPQLVKKQKG